MTLQEAYDLLDVGPATPIKQVKQSYRRAARVYHPDTGSGFADTDKFLQIVNAYNLILEEEKKKPAQLPPSNRVTATAPGPGRKRTRVWSAGVGWFESFKTRREKRGAGPANGASFTTSFSMGKPSLLTFEELVIRFDKSPNAWVRIEAAQTILDRFENRFESFAVPRLRGAPHKVQEALIKMLGEVGTKTALDAIVPYLESRRRSLCLAAFLALDNAGEAGRRLLDRRLGTPSSIVYNLSGLFGREDLERKILKARIMSGDRMRRLSAMTRRTGVPLQELLKGIGVTLPSSA